jgi:hypothetical protein
MGSVLCHSACTEESAPQLLPVRVHTLKSRGCDLPSELARTTLQLQALGDFAASNDSAEFLRLDQAGAVLKFPVATQAAVARVGDDSRAFTGYGERSGSGLDLLLWPELSSCQIWRRDGTHGYPGRHGGQALGYSRQSGVVLVTGGDDPLVSDAIVGALSFDVATGAIKTLDSSDDGVLRQPRAFATATPFGDYILVAGGEEPVFGVPAKDIEPIATAELFDPQLGRFSGEPIQLRSKRTHHAAVQLDDGRTLLVGGRSRVGTTNIAQYRLEIVDPSGRRASVADAIAPRIDPRALRLSDGRIFVGGGVGLEGALTEPVAEWITADGRLDSTHLASEVAPRFDRAFVATVGGGALAVGGCEDRPAATAEDAAACASCNHGCPPLGGEFDAWWIDADGAATPVSLAGISAPRPILLPGSDGRPWLVAAAATAPEISRLFRFDPWAERFEPADVPDSVQLPRPGMPEPLAIDPDAFVWMDDDGTAGQLMGLRLGTRNRFTQDLALVLLSDPIETRPQHLVPERPIGEDVSYDGRLTLSGPITVRVADTDYGDVTLRLHVIAGPPPVVQLGLATLGGRECPWPEGAERGGDFDRPTIIRQGNRAQLLFHGGATACPVEAGRLDLGLRAGAGVSVIQQLDVQRGAQQP